MDHDPSSSTIALSGSSFGTPLTNLLMTDAIVPGSEPSYQICKTIYVYHPLGKKMADSPIAMAQSQPRKISIPKSPEDAVRTAFTDEWAALGADKLIANVMSLSRVYGQAALAVLVKDVPAGEPLDFDTLWKAEISFNTFDPLNTAGSLVLNQDPNAMDFQKHKGITVQGTAYHRSKCEVVMHENPIYIEYTTASFGYVGRSVYQRALFPLKSFLQTMLTDDLITLKAGVLVAKMKGPGSIIDNMMAKLANWKRSLLKLAKTGSVISIDIDEDIQSLDLKNLDAPATMARKNILENIAVSADMPAKLLNSETFAEGFGEGTEDAKNVARYVEGIRAVMKPLYDFMDKICQYRAWNEEFYKTIQAQFPEYEKIQYKQAFYEWVGSFHTEWPNLLEEPDSEKVTVEDTKLKAIISIMEVLLPVADPENKARIIQWAADNVNENKVMFSTPLVIDSQAMAEYEPEPAGMPGAPGTEGDEPKGLKEPSPPRPESLNK